jgi:hypothetical protein
MIASQTAASDPATMEKMDKSPYENEMGMEAAVSKSHKRAGTSL